MQPIQAAAGVYTDCGATTTEIETSFVTALKNQLGQRKYNDWFQNKVTYTITNSQVVIGVGSDFLLNWLQREYLKQISQVAQTVIGSGTEVCFKVDARVAIDATDSSNKTNRPTVTSNKKTPTPSSEKKPLTEKRGRRFADLESFVVGAGTELAVTAIHQVCEAPGSQYNPLVLHGEVGLGKTHLLEGIYKRIRKTYPSLNVLYMTAEDFTNYFTSALRNHTLPSFSTTVSEHRYSTGR